MTPAEFATRAPLLIYGYQTGRTTEKTSAGTIGPNIPAQHSVAIRGFLSRRKPLRPGAIRRSEVPYYSRAPQTGKTTEKTFGRHHRPEHFSPTFRCDPGAFCRGANRCYPEQFFAAQAVASPYRHIMRGGDREREPVRGGCGGCRGCRRAARAPDGRNSSIVPVPAARRPATPGPVRSAQERGGKRP